MRWVTEDTKGEMHMSLAADEKTCLLFNYQTSKNKATLHIRQHFTRYFCICKCQSASRDFTYIHQKWEVRDICTWDKMVYKVDKENFLIFASYIKWDPFPTFRPCMATMSRGGQTSLTYTESSPPHKGAPTKKERSPYPEPKCQGVLRTNSQ